MNQMIRTIILLWSLGLTMGEETVTCLFSEDCVLPCQSIYHDIIHWYKGNNNLHSFYQGKDQLDNQYEDYKGRTALFSDQIPKGNTSLILRDIRIQDKGKYKCYTAITSDKRETYVNVNVKAPIKSVDIKKTDTGIICRTSEVYPKPIISWNVQERSQEQVSENSQGLFSLNSTLLIQPVQKSLKYSCNIVSADGTQTYTASLVQDETEIDSGEDVTIHCPDPQRENENFSLTLTFNDSSKVLSYSSQISQPNTKWMDTDARITPEGNIKLHKLDSEKYTGTYTCERSTAHSRQIMQTSVQVKPAGIPTFAIIIIVVIIIGVFAGIIFFLYKKWPFKTKENTEGDNSIAKSSTADKNEMESLNKE